MLYNKGMHRRGLRFRFFAGRSLRLRFFKGHLRWSARPIILVVMNREKMDKRLARLDTPESCERFAKNVEARGHPVLACEARRRATEIRAAHHGAELEVEREALQAVYAYEEMLTHKNGKRKPVSKTWQMISRHGILPAIERVVNRESDATGYLTLVEMEMTDLAFEAVVLRHPDNFSSENGRTCDAKTTRLEGCITRRSSRRRTRFARCQRLSLVVR